MKIKDIASSVFSKLFEVGEPQGSPEDPFGTQGGIDLNTVPGGEPSDGPAQQGQAQGQDQQAQSNQQMPDLGDAGDPDAGKKIDQSLIDFAKRHQFVTDHDHDDDDPIRYLKMSKEELKNEAESVKEELAKIEMNDDLGGVGTFDDDRHSYLTDKLKFLKDLSEKADED